MLNWLTGPRQDEGQGRDLAERRPQKDLTKVWSRRESVPTHVHAHTRAHTHTHTWPHTHYVRLALQQSH